MKARVRPFRVAFDMDGVLADLGGAVARESVALFGEATDPVEACDTRRRRRVWQHIESTQNFWETLDETEPGVVAALNALTRGRRWDVIFLTTRPETGGDPARIQTARWLAARGFEAPGVFVVRRSRGAIAAALELDAVVDDRVESCVDVVSESDARALLVWRREAEPPAIALNRVRIDVVRSAGDALSELGRIDAARRERPSRFSALLRTFAARPA